MHCRFSKFANIHRSFYTVASVAGSIALSSLTLQARTWTNSEGKKIEADYISHTEESVTIKFKGKDMQYALDKLSQEDRDWLKEQEVKKAEEEKARMEAVASLKGRRNDVPITDRMFEDTSDYFKSSESKAWIKKHEEGDSDSSGTKEDWLKRDASKDKCVIYCPDSYDGTEPYGVYLYVNHSPGGVINPQWYPILDKYKLIAVSANAVGNFEDQAKKKINPHPYRVTLSLDALATVEKQYKIDPARRIVGGTSGGGHMAFSVAALYPDLFKGAISCAAQSYLPGHFPGFEIGDFKKGDRKEMKWIVVSGDKDFNYKEILKTSEIWNDNKLDYRFLDVPGMGHNPHSPEHFEEALKWIGLTE